MIRGLTKLLVLVQAVWALEASAQTGASVCADILMSSDKVRCMQVIAGHAVDSGAASVCGEILMSSDKIACLRASLDKRYQAEELSACRGILMGPDKANCMAAAGAVPPPPAAVVVDERPRRDDDRRARRHGDDDDDDRRDARRSRRRDDDDEEAPRHRRAEPTRVLRVTNSFNTGVTRIFWRQLDERRFHDEPARIGANQYQDFTVPDEPLQVCVEAWGGFRLQWPKVRRSEAATIAADERNWVTGRCADL